jgi:hypothetical protein
MKKLRTIIITFAILVSFGIQASTVYAASGDTVVYITKTGECYHSSGCSSLRRSKIETTLQSAIDKGYRACSKCNPVSLDSSSQTTAAKSTTAVANTTTKTTVDAALEALKTYKGNSSEFNAYVYYINNADLQTAIGADGDKLLKHYNDYGKAEGRIAK